MAADGSSDIDSALWGGVTDDWGDEMTFGGGGGRGGGDNDDFELVYRAVAAGDSVEQVRSVIELCARGSAQRRAAVASRAGSYKAAGRGAQVRDETPLAAACRLGRGDLVALLVEAGADVRVGGLATPLAACIPYGDVETVRTLLRAGIDANAELSYQAYRDDWWFDAMPCSAAHLCLLPPRVPLDDYGAGPPLLEILEVLAREGNLDVNARGKRGRTPLFWVRHMGFAAGASGHEAAVDLLVSLGADVNARDGCGNTPLIALLKTPPYKPLTPCVRKLAAAGAQTSGVFGAYGCTPLAMAAAHGNVEAVRFLLEEAGAPPDERDPDSGRTALHRISSWWGHPVPICALLLDAGADVHAVDNQGRIPIFECTVSGHDLSTQVLRLYIARGASFDVTDCNGSTLLLAICSDSHSIRYRRSAVEEVVRHSSAQTRCAVDQDGRSAVDCVIDYARTSSYVLKPWHHQLIAELLSSGASVQAHNAAIVLPIAISHGLPLAARNEAELAARRSEGRRPCAREDLIDLAQDARELREAEQVVAAKRRRLEELEGEFGGSSATDSSGSSDDEGDEESDDGDQDDEGGAGEDDGGNSGGGGGIGSEYGSDEDRSGDNGEGDGQAGLGELESEEGGSGQ